MGEGFGDAGFADADDVGFFLGVAAGEDHLASAVEDLEVVGIEMDRDGSVSRLSGYGLWGSAD